MDSTRELSADQRFSRVTKDPRFWEMEETAKKVKIDKRFQAMFSDKKFTLNYTVDKRGRPINHTTKQDLKRYYQLSDTDEDVLPDEEDKKQKKKTKPKKKEKAKDVSTKIIKSKEEPETSKEDQNEKFGKKVKAKEKHITEKITTEEEIKTKKKLSSKVPAKSEKKSTNALKQEESEEESGLEDESDEYNNDQMNSDEEMSGMELEEDDESEEEGEDDGEESDDDDDESGSEEEEDSDFGPDLARGKGNIETSSEDEDDDEIDLKQKQMEIEHSWREMDKDAPRGDEITRRLAVCNMDWDRIKAKDLLALLSSFKPKGGMVFSVKIYLSEFGKKRLKEEENSGPIELRNLPEEIAKEKLFFKEKLREYQFKRLKYFYAVVECDSPETANKLYEECNGLEFETSCSFVDLRFIPDDIQFDDEPKDSAVDVDLSAYQPKYFTAAAMVTAKVDVSWDATDPDRISTLRKNFKKDELLDMDFQAYLASSSEEEEEEEEAAEAEQEVGSAKPGDKKSKKSSKDDEEQIERYRQLLKGIQEKEKLQEDKDVEMEVKWVPGLKEKAEKMVQHKLAGKDQQTPWEKYLEKRNEKRKLKRKAKKQAAVSESDNEDEIPSDVDFDDPFFSEEMKELGLKKKSASSKKQKDQDSSVDEEEKEKQNAEMALLMMDDVEDDRKHFNYDKIVEHHNLSRSKKKRLLKKKKEILEEDEFQINVDDSRFQSLFTSHLYNVDPSDPNFKKTKAMTKVLEEKAKRRERESKELSETVKKQKEKLEVSEKQAGTSSKKAVDPALSSLLKSIKSKTQEFQAIKRQKTK
ncbi:ESF1 homolog [Engystomops pustulosus]|uniref:ESF1 homolog n=1 Tax=Engystomops pustulosus TaxID=76066 RepID=UPI003AFB70FD